MNSHETEIPFDLFHGPRACSFMNTTPYLSPPILYTLPHGGQGCIKT